MQIKRFEARSMTEALRQIKRELGAEAVILSAKDIKKENRLLGITRTLGVEVTAAVDTQEGGPGASPARSGPDRGGRPAPPIFHGEDPGKGFIRRIQDVVSIRKSPPGGSSERPSREGESDRAAANLAACLSASIPATTVSCRGSLRSSFANRLARACAACSLCATSRTH